MNRTGSVPAGTDYALGEAAMRLASGFSRPAVVAARVSVIAICFDFVALSLAMWFSSYNFFHGNHDRPGVLDAFMLASMGVIAVMIFVGYSPRSLRNRWNVAQAAMLLAFVPLATMMLTHPPEAGHDHHEFPVVAAAVVVFAVLPQRAFVALLIGWAIESRLTARRAILAGGDPEEAKRVLRGLDAYKENDVRVCAIFDDRESGRVPERIFEVPQIGNFEAMVRFCQIAEIDLIIVTVPTTAKERLEEMMERLSVLPVAVHLSQISDDFRFPDTGGPGGRAMTFGFHRRLTKRLFDVVVGVAALLLLSPVMLVAALAVKLSSPGPILFKQDRYGFNHRIVKVWKFRSMYCEQSDPRGVEVVTPGDARVTPAGRIMRQFSIDELPQLFNVLQGSLSLVGPRPHALAAASSDRESFSDLVGNYAVRHRFPPGITGLAQVNGWRGAITEPEQLQRRIDDDLRYIENWSVWLDITILLRTPFAIYDPTAA
ncbi:exopolysaccharide biosynthesis polyprenyl glycosylphosphotransferase (plasmid) [Sulfitobacter sp. LCG007]